jgi:hypothetical protein
VITEIVKIHPEDAGMIFSSLKESTTCRISKALEDTKRDSFSEPAQNRTRCNLGETSNYFPPRGEQEIHALIGQYVAFA